MLSEKPTPNPHVIRRMNKLIVTATLLFATLSLSNLSYAGVSAHSKGGGVQVLSKHRKAYRMPVRSANPWFIKAMLEGESVVSPEFTFVSQIFGLPRSFGQSVGNAMNSLVKDGKLIVNPTDNSLWFSPDN